MREADTATSEADATTTRVCDRFGAENMTNSENKDGYGSEIRFASMFMYLVLDVRISVRTRDHASTVWGGASPRRVRPNEFMSHATHFARVPGRTAVIRSVACAAWVGRWDAGEKNA